MKNTKHFKKNDSRKSIDIKSHFKNVDTGIKNGVFIFSSPLSVEEFSKKINKSVSEILKFFFIKGIAMNLNSILSEDQIGELCLEFNYDFEKRTEINELNVLENIKLDDDPTSLKPRPPVVTIMGHVDHGKTTLLDYIRRSKVVQSEAGGITQHIGAYQVTYKESKITFIDTPGHAAFTQMRARGANVTDIVILIVAADDGIKPQTQEAISHAKAAKVPIIVFINKVDKPTANIDRVLSQLTEHDLTPESWGGSTITIEGSALNGQGVDKLLEAITTLSEINEYRSNPNRLASGIVLESNLDKGLGPTATVIIKNGTLVKSDFIICGKTYGRIRNMFDDLGKPINEALPSTPVKIVGLNEVPSAGDHFVVSNDEKIIKDLAKKIKTKLNDLQRLIEITNKSTNDQTKQLNIILKTDVHGSLEAIKGMLTKIAIEGTSLSIVYAAVGMINESDIQLAKATNGFIIGFNVKPLRAIKDMADSQGIKILFFNIIYELNDYIVNMLYGKLDPIYEEQETGEAEVLQIWSHSQVGIIAGCKVNNGQINRSDNARILREGKVIRDTKIRSLRHLKDDVNKVTSGMECGITVDNFNDIKVGDIIQTYKIIEKRRGSDEK